MSPQRQFLMSLHHLNIFSLHGLGGIRHRWQVYVILRLPRGNHWLCLNRSYQPLGYITNTVAQDLLTKYASAICSTLDEDYPHGGFNWKDGTWFEVRRDWCPNCDGIATNLHGQPRCETCGRFVNVR